MKNILKKRIRFIVIVIGVFLAINIALSFAYIRGGSVDSESVSTVVLTGGQILVRYSSNTGAIAISNIKPGYEGNKQFTITSDFGENHGYYVDGIWYTVALIIEKNDFDTNSIQYSLSLDNSSDNDGLTIANVQNEGISKGTNTSVILGSGRFDTHNKSHIYNLKINYPENGTDQSHEIGCEFHAYIDFINTNMVGLTFDLDGGSFTNLNLNENSSIKVPANSTINLPIPNKEGYIFAGWEVESVNASTNSNVILTGNSDISIKALWNDNIPYEFVYTGGEQQFIAEVPGYYKLETWGAQGGNVPDYSGGYGGYSRGIIMLKKYTNLYINIGGQGVTSTTYEANKKIGGGYNGGGYGYHYNDNVLAGGGGGATHIAFSSGILSKFKKDYIDILVVSGGGSGGYGYNSSWWIGNSGGGFIGGYSYESFSAGTQNSGYDFGQASDTSAIIENTNTNHSGGGGGFYGGHAYWGEIGAGGGSGYIGNSLLTDKYMYCYNCETSDVESTKTYSTTCAEETPTENCTKIGNGYARITYLHS